MEPTARLLCGQPQKKRDALEVRPRKGLALIAGPAEVTRTPVTMRRTVPCRPTGVWALSDVNRTSVSDYSIRWTFRVPEYRMQQTEHVWECGRLMPPPFGSCRYPPVAIQFSREPAHMHAGFLL